MELTSPINTHVTTMEMRKEPCAIVARFPEMSHETANTIMADMDDALGTVNVYHGIMPLADAEIARAKTVGITAVKVMFGPTHLAAAEQYTRIAADQAGERAGVPLLALVLQPIVLVERSQNWASLRDAGQIGPMQ